MAVSPEAIRDSIIERCHALGFAIAGVAAARPTSRRRELECWLDEGRHGEMWYLDERREQMVAPESVLAGARSVVVVADRYHSGPADPPEPDGTGRVARYARGDDYHVVIKKRLHGLADTLAGEHPDERFRVCVDTAPVLEREQAERAGLGAVGKHTLLIDRGVGSYLLLGEIITTLDLAPTPAVAPDPCGTCTRCIDACPTDAITPWSVDATRCISYLTIEHRSPIDERLHAGMGDWIFGCDVCQEVCPHNEPTERTRAADVHPAYTPRRTGFDLLEVLAWDESARREAFTRSAMKRAKLPMMKRNALIAAGNALAGRDDPALRGAIERLAGDPDEDPLVRDTASTVLERVGRGG